MATYVGIIVDGVDVVSGALDNNIFIGVINTGQEVGGVTDLDAPTFASIVPAAASSLAPTATFAFTVDDPNAGIGIVFAWVTYAGNRELMYDGVGFVGGYTGSATPVGTTIEFTSVGRTNGWLEGSITIEVRAVDLAGNVGTQSIAYTVSPDPAVITVGNQVPAVASVLAAVDSIQFDVTDPNDEIAKVVVSMGYEFDEDLMYDGTNFISPYTGTNVATTNGRRITVSRTGGWKEDVLTVRCVALDEQANEVTTTFGYTVSPDPTVIADVTPPTVTGVLPVDTSVLIAADTFEFDVTDPEDNLDSVLVWVNYEFVSELIYDGAAFVGGYTGTVTPIANGSGFTLVGRTGGWKEDVLTLHVLATDTAGNSVDQIINYTVSPDPTVVVDATPPVITNFDPVAATVIDPADSISVDVTDAGAGVDRAILRVQYADRQEMMYDGSGFVSPYTGSLTPIAGGNTYQVSRTGGWAASPLTITATAYDVDGNVADATSAYTAVPDPTPIPADAVPPVVANYDPAPGTALLPNTPVEFDVTDNTGNFRRVLIAVFFPSTGVTELAFDGDSFLGYYATTSSRAIISGGHRYTLLRSSGWVSAPTVRTFSIDLAGNEA